MSPTKEGVTSRELTTRQYGIDLASFVASNYYSEIAKIRRGERGNPYPLDLAPDLYKTIARTYTLANNLKSGKPIGVSGLNNEETVFLLFWIITDDPDDWVRQYMGSAGSTRLAQVMSRLDKTLSFSWNVEDLALIVAGEFRPVMMSFLDTMLDLIVCRAKRDLGAIEEALEQISSVSQETNSDYWCRFISKSLKWLDHEVVDIAGKLSLKLKAYKEIVDGFDNCRLIHIPDRTVDYNIIRKYLEEYVKAHVNG